MKTWHPVENPTDDSGQHPSRDVGGIKKDQDVPGKSTLIEQAETRTEQANLRTNQANTRMDETNTRTEQANMKDGNERIFFVSLRPESELKQLFDVQQQQ